MNHNPFVSVIIPNYCHSQYLDLRIQSILNQTYTNYEIIILDDCSPDNGASREVIEKYRSNSHVSHIVYNETNSGSTFKQWEKGLQLAKGSLIWIAESDDYCEAQLLEGLVQEFITYPRNVIAYTTSTLVDKDGKVFRIPRIRMTEHFSGKRFISHAMVYGNAIVNASSCMFNKEAALHIEKDYMAYRGAGDRLFWIRIAELGEVSVLHKGWNYFRQHGTNTTSACYANGTNFIEDKRIDEYLRDKGYMSYIKQCSAKWLKNKRIKDTLFVSDEVQGRITQLWKITPFEASIGKFAYWIHIVKNGLRWRIMNLINI